ncbi:MAG: autotransporter-associated beta strand repeat-containing protein, partial [Gammaproteobacteria bacterium]|nr:autotransporter-associated beta strand repeat-containing protein [Gammaproteobacteria bacterium]
GTINASGKGALIINDTTAARGLAYGTFNEARELILDGDSDPSIINNFQKVIDNNNSLNYLTSTSSTAHQANVTYMTTGLTSLTKNGSNTWALSTTMNYTGATQVNAGSLILTGGRMHNTAVTVESGATFGMLTNAGYALGWETASSANYTPYGATLNLKPGSNYTMSNNNAAGVLFVRQGNNFDGTGLTAGTGITIGAASGAAVKMSFDLLGTGVNTMDTIRSTKAIVIGSSGIEFTINPLSGLTDLTGVGATVGNSQTFWLMYSNGSTLSINGVISNTMALTEAEKQILTLSSSGLIVGTHGFKLTLERNTNKGLQLRVTRAAITPVYWTGATGATDGNWNDADNWYTHISGTTGGETRLPDVVDDVFLTANTASNLTMTLGKDFEIGGLTFRGTGTPAAAGNITLSGANVLSINSLGITVEAGSGRHTINSTGLRLVGDQTWDVANDPANFLRVDAIVSDIGAGKSLTKAGSGTVKLNGANTYQGATTINGGVLEANTLANGGLSSSIGAASVDAQNLVLNGGTLRYTGAQTTSNRLFSVGAAGGTIDASGSGALTFAATGIMAYNGDTSGTRLLTLTGDNMGLNTLVMALGDVSISSGNETSLTKTGIGTWVLAPNNGATNINGKISGSTPNTVTEVNTDGLILRQLISGDGIVPGTYIAGFITRVIPNPDYPATMLDENGNEV